MNTVIYGVSFKKKKDVLFCLGYKQYISEWQIKNQYHGLENLIKNRLGLQDDKEIKNKLQELRDNYYKSQELNINESVLMVLKSGYNLLTGTQRSTLLTSIATVTGQDVETLKAEVKNFINQ